MMKVTNLTLLSSLKLHMKKKSFSHSDCPIAKTLDCVGEWWSLLIIRDATHGLKRFDEFQKSLEIAPNMLTRRLKELVNSGLLEKLPYSDRPPRYEYHLTEKGQALQPVLIAMLSWGNQFLANESPAIQITDKASGIPIKLMMVDQNTGKTISAEHHQFTASFATSESMRNRIDMMQKNIVLNDSTNQNADQNKKDRNNA